MAAKRHKRRKKGLLSKQVCTGGQGARNATLRSVEPEGFKAISPGSSECNERTPGENDQFAIHPEGVAARSRNKGFSEALKQREVEERAATSFGVYRGWARPQGYRSFLAQPLANGFEPFGFSVASDFGKFPGVRVFTTLGIREA